MSNPSILVNTAVKHVHATILFLCAACWCALPQEPESPAESESIESKVNGIFTRIRMTRSREERNRLLRGLFLLGTEAEESVIEYLNDEDKSIVIDAVKFLTYIQSPKAKQNIMSLTIHPNWEIRFYAVLGLKSYTDDRAVLRIADAMLEDKNPEVRKVAVLSLMMIRNPLKIEQLIRGIKTLKGEPGNLCLSALQRVLKEEQYALDFVSYYRKHQGTIPHFLSLDIIRGLGDIADRRTIPFFRENLKSENSEIRALSAIGLGKIGDTRGIAILYPHINDPSATVREHVKRSLMRITGFLHWEDPKAVKRWRENNARLVEHAVQHEMLIEKALSADMDEWDSIHEQIASLHAGIGKEVRRVFSDIIARCLLAGNTKTVEFAISCFGRFGRKLSPALQYILKHGATDALVIEKTMLGACELASVVSYRFGLHENVPFIIAYLKNLENLSNNRDLLIKTPISYLCLQGITGSAVGNEAEKWERWWRKNRKRFTIQKSRQ